MCVPSYNPRMTKRGRRRGGKKEEGRKKKRDVHVINKDIVPCRTDAKHQISVLNRASIVYAWSLTTGRLRQKDLKFK